VGYKSSENVTVKIVFGAGTINSTNATATPGGLITTSWKVPSNASIGTYIVNITSVTANPTIKNPPDIDFFTVPGFDVDVTTKNLAGETVSNVAIRVFENAKSVVNLTSTSNGLAHTKLEVGNYTSEAFYKGEKVGELPINVTEMITLDFNCTLTNLKIFAIAKVDGANVPIPEVKVSLSSTPENKTLSTNTTGIAIGSSLLPNQTYVLNASRYGISFNVTSLPTLFVNGTAIAWYNLTLISPTLILRVNTTKSNNEPISGVTVIAQELMGGLRYEGNTDTEGIIAFNSAFGKYTIEVYDADGIKLNETTVNLFQNQSVSIICRLYGLTVSIRVVDYFGQPMSNVNITVQRENAALLASRTQANGVATFTNITGGSLLVSTYLFDQVQPDVARVFNVENSTTIEIKLEAYVMLAGFLVKTPILATAIVIAVALLLVLTIEVYRRKRFKPQKTSKPEQK
jgi:hypothetical protein